MPALVITPLSGPGAGERTLDAGDEFATGGASDIAPGAAFNGAAEGAAVRSVTDAGSGPVAAFAGRPQTGALAAAAAAPGADEFAAPAGQALPSPPRDTRLIDALELARARLSSGALIDPEYDSALFHFRQARALAPDNAQVAAGMETIFRSLTIRALGAAAIADWDTADRLLDAAARLDGDLSVVVQAREQVLERRIAAESGTVLPMAELTRVELKAPRYPRRALHTAVEGWAMVEFTVTIDGSTTDIDVVGTSDRYGEQFARSAVQAVEEWRFTPRVFRGRKIPQRTSTRLTFDIDK